jgi:hypothetical protein
MPTRSGRGIALVLSRRSTGGPRPIGRSTVSLACLLVIHVKGDAP